MSAAAEAASCGISVTADSGIDVSGGGTYGIGKTVTLTAVPSAEAKSTYDVMNDGVKMRSLRNDCPRIYMLRGSKPYYPGRRDTRYSEVKITIIINYK